MVLISLWYFPDIVEARGVWRTLKTEHFTVFYRKGDEARARELLSGLERARPVVEKITGNQRRHIPVVIQDMGVMVNGLTDPLNEVIQVFPRAPDSRLGLPTENWFHEVGLHEYVHMLNLSKAGGLPGLLKTLGGTSVNCNMGNPNWAIEGIAVYGESQVSPYAGRLNDGFFDASQAAMAAEGRFPSIHQATHQPWQYPNGIAYFSGGPFHGYLARTFGAESLTRFYADYSSRFLEWLSPVFPCVGIDRAAHKAFGKSLPGLWRDERHAVERSGFARESGEERLTYRGWDIDGLTSGGGCLYYRRSYPIKTQSRGGFVFNKIYERNLSSSRERCLVSSRAALAGPLRYAGGKLYYLTEVIRRGYPNTTTFGYIHRLHSLDVATGRRRTLYSGEVRAFEALSDGTMVMSQDMKERFGSRVLSLVPGQKNPVELFTTDLLVDDFLADGDSVYATARRQDHQFSIYRVDLKSGTFKPLVDTPWIERCENVCEGKIVFTANYNRVYGAYSMDSTTGEVLRLTKGGYASSAVSDKEGGWIYYAGLNAKGGDLYRAPYHPEPYDIPAPEGVPSNVIPDPLKGLEVGTGNYGDDLNRMAPRILHMPFFYHGGGEESYGMVFAGGDAVYDFPAYAVGLGYDRARQRPMGTFAVTSAFLAPLALAFQTTDAFGDRSLTAWGAYPLHVSLSEGFSSMWLGTVGNLHDQYRRKEVNPYLSSGFQWPGLDLSLYAETPQEKISWGSSIDRSSFYGGGSARARVGGGQVRLGGQWVWDPQNPDWPLGTPRGYHAVLRTFEGGRASIDLTAPVLKVRHGFWNPCFYVEDLVLNLFSEGAWARRGGGRQVSWGVETRLEMSLTTAAIPLDWVVRCSRSQEGENTYENFISFNLPWQIGLFRSKAVPQLVGDLPLVLNKF